MPVKNAFNGPWHCTSSKRCRGNKSLGPSTKLAVTPPQIDIEPENDGLVKMIFPFLSGANGLFSGSITVKIFRGPVCLINWKTLGSLEGMFCMQKVTKGVGGDFWKGHDVYDVYTFKGSATNQPVYVYVII